MPYSYENLVIEGGGVRGIAFGGTLQKLEELGVLPNIRRVIGSSAGAITAGAVACCIPAADIKQI